MDPFFIECVKQHPSLWDTYHPSYRHLKVRDAAWKDVIKKTKIGSVALAKSKWKNLRDTHREALKNTRKRNHCKTWKYMSKMEFLIPHMSNRQKETNSPPPQDLSMEADDTVSSDHTDNTDSVIVDTLPLPCKTTKVELCTDDDDLFKLYKKIENEREQRTKQREELRQELFSDDPLKSFFDSMYKSTKQMPEYFQRSIKRKLFQLVMEAEDNISSGLNCQISDYNPNDSAEQSHSTHLTNDSSVQVPSNVYCVPKAGGPSSQQLSFGVFVCNKRRNSDPDITPSDNVII
ncbi:unnamed protein product [Diatraea saccharalis]|uniref:MADF domain-containing protein n=1 Tax=Diatraea saccharalis TaxID=40085 RepID=A0A9N9R159_9NEOP|nr:unnamed protein product [Diatraea saccharalis]